MSNIDWNQKRNLFRNTETGEIYVRVETGYMLVEDYVEGGRVELGAHVQPLEKIGKFTNAQIDNGDYLTERVDDRLAEYGVRFEGEQGPYVQTDAFMTLAELVARGGRIVRVRWIGGEYVPGRGRCYDLSYIHGEIGNARVSITHLPAAFLVPRRELKGEMIAWAKEEGVYAKGCGLLDNINYSILG